MNDQVEMLATSIFVIEGADQPGQIERVKRTVKKMPGVRDVEINYVLDTAKVLYDPNKLSLALIKAAMK